MCKYESCKFGGRVNLGPCKLGACKVERVRLSRVNVRNVSLGWRRHHRPHYYCLLYIVIMKCWRHYDDVKMITIVTAL